MWPRSIHLHVAFLLGLQLLSIAATDTQFEFSSFGPESEDDILTIGDAAYDATNRSFIINAGGRTLASRGTCGALFYGKTVRIQNVATGRVASFSTTFSFKFTTHGKPWDNTNNTLDGSGISIALIRDLPMIGLSDIISQLGKFGACKTSPLETAEIISPIFAVNFHTDYNPSHQNEPSNNFIRIARNPDGEYDADLFTYNLCGNDTHCSYFSDGRIFTAWIDFTSSSQTLDLRMAHGSSPTKPLQPLLLLSDYKFPKSIGDEVLLTIWGSSDVNHVEEHEMLSWSFFSTGTSSESKVRRLLHYLKSRSWVGIPVGGVLFGTLTALVILWSIYSFAKPTTSYTALGLSTGPHVFSFNELRKATANFDEKNLLGRGGSGLVYKGSLPSDGYLVAVKQISMLGSKQAETLFHAEVATLSQIRHRNVVRLQGWCQEKGKLLLVYDYMSNGTLNDWLYKKSNQNVLSLKLRHSILEGVGAALGYLHEDCLRCVLHRDIKSSNVLLDANFNAYLGDFGLARLMDHHKLDKTTMAAGTFGYMAPELPYTSKATKESDVYSFGILVLEVVCGRRPVDMRTVEPEDLVLLFAVWRAHEGGSLLKMVDPRVFESFQPSYESNELSSETSWVSSLPSESSNSNRNSASGSLVGDVNIEIQSAMVVSLLQLGLFCCLPNPKARPSIGEVKRLLQQIGNIEYEPSVMRVPMLSLPTTKPLALYHSLEFSNGAMCST